MLTSPLRFSIKKKVKGGSTPGGAGSSRTLPSNSNGSSLHGMHGSQLQPFEHSNKAEDVISSAIVKYNYQAQQLDELSLVKGSRVLILEKSGDGWWRGQLGNKIGWFPSNYTQEELEDAHTYCLADSVLDVMVALYPFRAQNDTELSFEKGDRLEVIDKPADDPDWFKARNTQAQIGLVPKNYLIELSQYLASEVGNKPNSGANAESLAKQPWYYGSISRMECDDVLAQRGIDGDFLIRDSETTVR
jgi:NCK adaptor protein